MSYLKQGSATFGKETRSGILGNKLYDHEYESSLLNKLGPGPGSYNALESMKKLVKAY